MNRHALRIIVRLLGLASEQLEYFREDEELRRIRRQINDAAFRINEVMDNAPVEEP